MILSNNSVTLPYNHFTQTSLRTFKEPRKIKRVLMIEDDSDMYEILAKTLRMRYNCHVDIAPDPFEAINLMSEKFFDLIILDWALPGLSGPETLVQAEKLLKMDPALPIQWDREKVPVVLFSASKKNECHTRRTKHFNFVGYISKSQSLKDIVDAFGSYITDDYSLLRKA